MLPEALNEGGLGDLGKPIPNRSNELKEVLANKICGWQGSASIGHPRQGQTFLYVKFLVQNIQGKNILAVNVQKHSILGTMEVNWKKYTKGTADHFKKIENQEEIGLS